MAQVRLLGGKPLLIKGKVALSDDCCCKTTVDCCANCALPSGECPHAVCFSFTLDANDTSNKDIFELTNAIEDNGLGFYYDGVWNLYGFEGGSGVIAATPPVLATWHCVAISITRIDDDNASVSFSVDGSGAASFTWPMASDSKSFTKIFAGAYNGTGNAHRAIRCITALGNPANSETNFQFQPDTFDSFVGGASIVPPVLRIDDEVGDAYGRKNVAYDMTCKGPCTECPVDQGSGLLTVGATYTITAYAVGDDFTNVGAASNMTGEVFEATGTTPTTWTNGSVLKASVHVIVSDVVLCGCIDTGGSTSFEMVDAHFPAGGSGINSEYIVNASGSFWERFLDNFTLTDPYFYPLTYAVSSNCSTPAGADLSQCIIHVECTGSEWTVTIAHAGFGLAFQGTGCGTVDDPIFNEFETCSDVPRQIGTFGRAVISLI